MRPASPYQPHGKQDQYRIGLRRLMSALAQYIRAQIAQTGPMSFARFMELALYHPKLGYYQQPHRPIGRRGDFYTSVSVGCVFGQLLAFQFAEWLQTLPGRCVRLIEAGSHDGRLAGDVLAWLSRHRPGLLDRLQYWILEPSDARQAQQRRRLEQFADYVHWITGWNHLPEAVRGVIFSNELLDAMPVRRLGWDAQARRWFEWLVDVQDQQFVWRRGPISPAEMARLFQSAKLVIPDELAEVLPDGFTLEVSPAAAQWWQQAAEALAMGWLVTIDYGLTADQLLRPERLHGTLRAYYHHRPAHNPLANVGQQDLTAHVNFTQLQAVGEAAGLRTVGLWSQGQFLTRIAQQLWAAPEQFESWPESYRRQFTTLTHPEHLGRAFYVLVQTRLADVRPALQSGACNSQLNTAKQ